MPQTCLLSIYLQFWWLKWQEINAISKTPPDLRTFIHTEWDSRSDKMFVLEEKSRLQKCLPLPSHHITDGTKWTNKRTGGVGSVETKNLNTVVLCSQPTNWESPIPLLQYLLQRPPVRAHIGHDISRQLPERRNLGSMLKAPLPG